MTTPRRGKIFIDAQVQGALTVRVIMYWLYCLMAVALMLACWTILNDHPRSSAELCRLVWSRGGPALLGSLLVLPIVMVDCVRMSNRFAGPLVRLRRSMQQLAAGQPAQCVHVRKHDFWGDFAEDFNRVLERLQGDGERAPVNTMDLPAESSQPSDDSRLSVTHMTDA